MTETMNPPRRKVDYAVFGLLLAIVVQFASTVWWASRLSSTVDALNSAAVEMRGTVANVQSRLQDHSERIRVLEFRMDHTAPAPADPR